jgi:hypothetical protein
VTGTPTVFVGATGDTLQKVDLTSLEAPVTVAALNAALAATES